MCIYSWANIPIQWNPSYLDPTYPGTSVIRTANLMPKIKINVNGVNYGKTEECID